MRLNRIFVLAAMLVAVPLGASAASAQDTRHMNSDRNRDTSMNRDRSDSNRDRDRDRDRMRMDRHHDRGHHYGWYRGRHNWHRHCYWTRRHHHHVRICR